MKHTPLLAFALIGILSFLGCTSTGSLQKGKSANLDYDSMMRMDFAKIEALAQKGNPVAQYVMAGFYLDGGADPQPDKEIGISWLKKAVKTGARVVLFPEEPFMRRMVDHNAMWWLLYSCENEQDFIKYKIDVDQLVDALRSQYYLFIDSAIDGDLESKIGALGVVYRGDYTRWVDSKGKEKVLWIIKPNHAKAKELYKSILASVQKGVSEKDYELMDRLSGFYSYGFQEVKEDEEASAIPEISKPDETAGAKWKKKATQVATELAKSGDAKAIHYLFGTSGENGPEAWLIKAMEKLADKGDLEAMGKLAESLSFDKPADALVWHRIHGALTRIDPSLLEGLEELSSGIYKELSAEQIAVAAQKAERWLEAHPQITRQSDFLRIVADADIGTLDKDGNRIEQPRMFSDRDASNETSVLKGSKKPYTGMVRKFDLVRRGRGNRFLQLEVNFLNGKLHGGLHVWDRDSVKRHESKFNHGKRVLRKLWFQDGEFAEEKRWNDKGVLIYHLDQIDGKKEVILDKR